MLGRCHSILKIILTVVIASSITHALGESFPLPPEDVDLIGSLSLYDAKPGEFPVDIAREEGVGQDELLTANPTLSRWIPIDANSSKQVLLPTRFILPAQERHGMVINLAEKRLYYYPEVENLLRASMVLSYPVSIGQQDWSTPLTNTSIIRRQTNPSWYPPASIKLEAAQRGIELPDVVAPGPDNPLGNHAIYLDIPGYLIHGTSKPNDIGRRVTHGCIRMYPDDIEYLYSRISMGTSVRIIHEPIKVGWHAGKLYLEVHTPLSEMNMSDDELYHHAIDLVKAALQERPVTSVQSRTIRRLVEEKSGVPYALNTTPVDRPQMSR